MNLNSFSTIYVGFSGGSDSVYAAQWCAAQNLNFTCLHVLHQQDKSTPNTDTTLEHVKALCSKQKWPLLVVDATLCPNEIKNKGWEAASRKARYEAFKNVVKENVIILGHHQDDVMETMLMRMFRGSGVKGLTGMADWLKQGCWIHRPFLNLSKFEMVQSLKNSNLTWYEDESNKNTLFKRNAVRHVLIPVLEKVFPKYRTTLTRLMQSMIQTQTLLNEIAKEDWNNTNQNIQQFKKLSQNRQINMLRYKCAELNNLTPSESQVMEMIKHITLNTKPNTQTISQWTLDSNTLTFTLTCQN